MRIKDEPAKKKAGEWQKGRPCAELRAVEDSRDHTQGWRIKIQAGALTYHRQEAITRCRGAWAL